MGINRRVIWLACAAVPTIAFAACVGDSPIATVDAGPDVTTIDAAPDADEPFEAGVELEGGVILDGGGNPDDTDSGLVVDAGKDAGTCGVSGAAPSVTSGCAYLFFTPGGGSLATVTYHLTGFTVYGTASYCQNTFKSGTYSGKLTITKNPNNSYTFQERLGPTNQIYLPPNTPNKNFTVIPSGTSLAVAQTCGNVVSDTSWEYTTGGTVGARTINYVRASGSSTIKLYWAQD